VTERVALPAAKRIRIVATLVPGAAPDEFVATVAAVGGAVIACDTRTVTADVPGGAMGRLALVDCVAAIRAGEAWDAPGRQPPDGSPEVRRRLQQRELDSGTGRPGEPQDPLED
jgi:hypothetical protein